MLSFWLLWPTTVKEDTYLWMWKTNSEVIIFILSSHHWRVFSVVGAEGSIWNKLLDCYFLFCVLFQIGLQLLSLDVCIKTPVCRYHHERGIMEAFWTWNHWCWIMIRESWVETADRLASRIQYLQNRVLVAVHIIIFHFFGIKDSIQSVCLYLLFTWIFHEWVGVLCTHYSFTWGVLSGGPFFLKGTSGFW